MPGWANGFGARIMRRDQLAQVLADNREQLREFAVKSLSVFGSTARGEATDASDVDLLVEFDDGARVGLFRFIELKQFLETTLRCSVDLGTADTLRSPLRQRIQGEAIRVV
jgi:predicted nucleotidyltransferase